MLRRFVVQGITGGVTSFPEFEEKFFPEVIGQQGGSQGVTYCQYDNQPLQLFTSSLYLAGIFSSLVGGYTSRCFPSSLILSLCDALLLCAMRHKYCVPALPYNTEACWTNLYSKQCARSSWGQSKYKYTFLQNNAMCLCCAAAVSVLDWACSLQDLRQKGNNLHCGGLFHCGHSAVRSSCADRHAHYRAHHDRAGGWLRQSGEGVAPQRSFLC
jgi:hypothetical protein